MKYRDWEQSTGLNNFKSFVSTEFSHNEIHSVVCYFEKSLHKLLLKWLTKMCQESENENSNWKFQIQKDSKIIIFSLLTW